MQLRSILVAAARDRAHRYRSLINLAAQHTRQQPAGDEVCFLASLCSILVLRSLAFFITARSATVCSVELTIAPRPRAA